MQLYDNEDLAAKDLKAVLMRVNEARKHKLIRDKLRSSKVIREEYELALK
jgi:hypothetical protein